VEYTCRVCHFELGFEMKVNSTEITMEKIKKGEYCGACHNGEIAFSPARGNCRKCHNGNLSYSDDKFKKLDYLPKSQYGNGINWTKAIMWGLIRPKESLINPNFKRIPFNEVVELEPEWSGVLVDAYFPHEEHSVWLDCADCHPDVFNIQKKGTKNFLMQYILEGKFCGYCHLNVAFPINECRKCHPMMKE
jgi:c(7)-type cytochrome triheme protein